MKKVMISVLFLLLLSGTPLFADTVTFVPGTTQQTNAVTEWATYGDMMDGMKVTAYFASGGFEEELWADIAYQAGGVFGTGWSLTKYGDTWYDDWTLSSSVPITRLLLDPGADLTVFDIAWDPYPGTPNSENGWTFQRTSGGVTVDATYRDLVALTGQLPVGDLYRYLDLAFQGGFSGNMTFRADTDNITSLLQPVPEPTTLLLLGAGLIGLLGLRRKFRK